MSEEQSNEELIAGPDDAGRRLDKVLRSLLKRSSLSEIYAALRKGRIRVNGAKAEPELRLAKGDIVFVQASLLRSGESSRGLRDQEGLDSISDILLLATEDLLFINKPRGELSQGSEGLEGRIRRALASRADASLSFSPGPLHRLDRNTTGVMAFPRSAEGGRAFASLLRERGIAKRYLGLVDGEVAAPEEWRDRISRDGASRRSSVSEDGAEASAGMRPLLAHGGRSLLLVELRSGLTHQIRVQSSSRGFPLSGDAKYGGGPFAGGYILHAHSLGFPAPPFPDTPPVVTAPLPAEARARLEALFGASALQRALDAASARPGR